MNAKVAMLSVFAVFFIMLMSGCTNENSGNGSNDLSWLNNYTPVHSLGNGENDFWVDFPLGNPSSSQSVDHLQWVLDSLEKNCVLFVVHITGCVGCQAQADRVIELAEEYIKNVEFYDLDAVDNAPEDILQKAYGAYLYDPNGPPGYIALTCFFTYVKDNGELKIGWHAWEGDVEDSEMEDWIKDGIYYYYLYSEG